MRALDRGGGLVVPGVVSKFAAFAVRFVPRGKVARLIKKISKPPFVNISILMLMLCLRLNLEQTWWNAIARVADSKLK